MAGTLKVIDGHGLDRTIHRSACASNRLQVYWAGFEWVGANINGTRDMIVKDQGETHATASFGCDDADRAPDIYIMRNPEKLAPLNEVAIP